MLAVAVTLAGLAFAPAGCTQDASADAEVLARAHEAERTRSAAAASGEPSRCRAQRGDVACGDESLLAMELYIFVNYTSSTYSLSVTTYESIDVYEMVQSGGPAAYVESHSSGTWDLRVPAGGIWAFGAAAGLSYTPPNPSQLLILTANEKDPWPEPPAAPAQFGEMSETAYEELFEDFLEALFS